MFLFYYSLSIVFGYIIFKLFKFTIYQFKLYQSMKNLPGPEIEGPLKGNLNYFSAASKLENKEVTLKNEFSDKWDELFKSYGQKGLIRMWMGPFKPFVLIGDADLTKKMLSKHLDKSSHYDMLTNLVGTQSLMTCKSENYGKLRTYFTTFFNVSSLETYIPRTLLNLSKLNQRIDALVDSNDGRCEQSNDLIKPFVLDTLGLNFFSTNFDSISKNQVPYWTDKMFDLISVLDEVYVSPLKQGFGNRFLMLLMQMPGQLLVHKGKHLKIYYHYISALIRMIFDVRKNIFKNITKFESVRPTLLESLILKNLPQRTGLFEQIKGNVTGFWTVLCHLITFVNTGYLSTTPTLSWALYLLAKHPHVQENLRTEIDSFKQNLDEAGEEITILNLKRLKYLEATIKEVLRLNPPVNFIGRHVQEDHAVNGQTTIPGGIDAIFSLNQIHTSERYFREPEQFLPERFLMQNSAESSDTENNKFDLAYIPFSFGRRICPGKDYAMMTAKLLIINFVTNYEFTLLDQVEESDPKYALFLTPKNYGLKFVKRF